MVKTTMFARKKGIGFRHCRHVVLVRGSGEFAGNVKILGRVWQVADIATRALLPPACATRALRAKDRAVEVG
jgi:hypothetical protein